MMIMDIVDSHEYNHLLVTNNGEKLAEREMNWPYTFRQRHMPIVANNVVVKAGIISIEFANEEQADSFSGCGFILGE